MIEQKSTIRRLVPQRAADRDGAEVLPTAVGIEPRVSELEQEVRRLQQIVAEQKLRIDALAR